MNNTNLPSLPPLPSAGERGPEVCAVVRLYLAVIDDLALAQLELVNAHVAGCAACGEDFAVLERATQLVGKAAATAPSPRVDAAIRAMIEGRARGQETGIPTRIPTRGVPTGFRRTTLRSRLVNPAGALVTAAMILLALFASLHFSSIFDGAGNQNAFALPSSLSWNQYVLFHSQTRMSASGQAYQVESYNDLGTGSMHVETTMGDQLDVVVVGDNSEMVGLDMIHHVAQMNADQWAVDDSVFNLNVLRHDLQAKNDVYLGTVLFNGQPVYRIRCQDGLVMLLDMQYRPVNVLRGDTDQPIYTTLQLIPSSQVSSSMWDMSIPQGYHMGTLPALP